MTLVWFCLFDTKWSITKLDLELAHYFVYVESPGAGALDFQSPRWVRWGREEMAEVSQPGLDKNQGTDSARSCPGTQGTDSRRGEGSEAPGPKGVL